MNIHQVAMGCKPDPAKFTVVQLIHVGANTIVVANYGGATFNGNKLMVLRGRWLTFETLDPHFLNEEYPVIARFTPTDEGMAMARLVAAFIGRTPQETVTAIEGREDSAVQEALTYDPACDPLHALQFSNCPPSSAYGHS